MPERSDIKISFGIIVLNGEPFTEYTIRALYPHAHQIIVVEGASPGGRYVANEDGHSLDGTLDMLRKFKRLKDPHDKILIVTAEDEGHPSGFWPGEKDEQSSAYAKRATGDYLWQVDIDEFYKDEDIKKVKKMLTDNTEITAVSFRQKQFWGGFDYLVDSWLLRRGADEFHRLFKWGDGYTYVTHRPPTVTDQNGFDTRKIQWVNANQMKEKEIYLYHYSFVFPKQVREKASYYKNADWSKRNKMDWWAEDVYMKLADPFSVFSVYWDVSWLKRFSGTHPKQIYAMLKDIKSGELQIETRKTKDIEKLLESNRYRFKVLWYKFLNPLNYHFKRYYKSLKRKIKNSV